MSQNSSTNNPEFDQELFGLLSQGLPVSLVRTLLIAFATTGSVSLDLSPIQPSSNAASTAPTSSTAPSSSSFPASSPAIPPPRLSRGSVFGSVPLPSPVFKSQSDESSTSGNKKFLGVNSAAAAIIPMLRKRTMSVSHDSNDAYFNVSNRSSNLPPISLASSPSPSSSSSSAAATAAAATPPRYHQRFAEILAAALHVAFRLPCRVLQCTPHTRPADLFHSVMGSIPPEVHQQSPESVKKRFANHSCHVCNGKIQPSEATVSSSSSNLTPLNSAPTQELGNSNPTLQKIWLLVNQFQEQVAKLQRHKLYAQEVFANLAVSNPSISQNKNASMSSLTSPESPSSVSFSPQPSPSSLSASTSLSAPASPDSASSTDFFSTIAASLSRLTAYSSTIGGLVANPLYANNSNLNTPASSSSSSSASSSFAAEPPPPPIHSHIAHSTTNTIEAARNRLQSSEDAIRRELAQTRRQFAALIYDSFGNPNNQPSFVAAALNQASKPANRHLHHPTMPLYDDDTDEDHEDDDESVDHHDADFENRITSDHGESRRHSVLEDQDDELDQSSDYYHYSKDANSSAADFNAESDSQRHRSFQKTPESNVSFESFRAPKEAARKSATRHSRNSTHDFHNIRHDELIDDETPDIVDDDNCDSHVGRTHSDLLDTHGDFESSDDDRAESTQASFAEEREEMKQLKHIIESQFKSSAAKPETWIEMQASPLSRSQRADHDLHDDDHSSNEFSPSASASLSFFSPPHDMHSSISSSQFGSSPPPDVLFSPSAAHSSSSLGNHPSQTLFRSPVTPASLTSSSSSPSGSDSAPLPPTIAQFNQEHHLHDSLFLPQQPESSHSMDEDHETRSEESMSDHGHSRASTHIRAPRHPRHLQHRTPRRPPAVHQAASAPTAASFPDAVQPVFASTVESSSSSSNSTSASISTSNQSLPPGFRPFQHCPYRARPMMSSSPDGPIFSNICVIQDVHLAPASVQTAVMEAIRLRTVSFGGKTHSLPSPSLIIVTHRQDEASYRLQPMPQALMDLFALEMTVQPSLSRSLFHYLTTPSVLNYPSSLLDHLSWFRSCVHQIPARHSMTQYIRDISVALRQHPLIAIGPSPSAQSVLKHSACAHALLHELLVKGSQFSQQQLHNSNATMMPNGLTADVPFMSHSMLKRGLSAGHNSRDRHQNQTSSMKSLADSVRSTEVFDRPALNQFRRSVTSMPIKSFIVVDDHDDDDEEDQSVFGMDGVDDGYEQKHASPKSKLNQSQLNDSLKSSLSGSSNFDHSSTLLSDSLVAFGEHGDENIEIDESDADEYGEERQDVNRDEEDENVPVRVRFSASSKPPARTFTSRHQHRRRRVVAMRPMDVDSVVVEVMAHRMLLRGGFSSSADANLGKSSSGSAFSSISSSEHSSIKSSLSAFATPSLPLPQARRDVSNVIGPSSGSLSAHETARRLVSHLILNVLIPPK